MISFIFSKAKQRPFKKNLMLLEWQGILHPDDYFANNLDLISFGAIQ